MKEHKITQAQLATRNTMTDCIRATLAQFKQRIVDKKDGPDFQRVYLDDVLSDDERMLQIEAIADPHTQTPEQIYINKEHLTELYAALDKLTASLFLSLMLPRKGGNLSRQNAATVAALSGACYNSGCHLLHKGITH